MGLVIGMDEAGYGPNLGPLVVTVTVWEVPGLPRQADFWEAMADIVSNSPPTTSKKLQIADSKEVYSPARGLARLERSVLCAMSLLGPPVTSYQDLCSQLTGPGDATLDQEPWFDHCDLNLPHSIAGNDLAETAMNWRDCLQQQGYTLKAIRSEIVSPQRFNRAIEESDGKGRALSRISLGLLAKVWDVDTAEPTLIVADKHGGRNRYHDLLAEILDGQMVFQLGEAKSCSTYRVGNSEVQFQMRAESHLPVALASMVCKYVRELAMTLFNQYWCEHVPGLKPTKGYPQDARRFKADIAEAQTRLAVVDDILWRNR